VLDGHATRCGVVDLMGNTGGVSRRGDEDAHRIVKFGEIWKLACNADGACRWACQLADSFRFIDSSDDEWNFTAQPGLDLRKNFFEKPNHRIAVRACLFMNGANEQESASLVECPGRWLRRNRMPQDVN